MTSQATFATNPEAAYQRYLEEGFFVEPEAIDPATCDRLIAAAETLPTAKDGSYIPMMQVHRIDPVFLEAMSDPRIVGPMDRMVHGQAVGLQTQLFFTPPQRAGLGFHQDNYFVEAPDDAFSSAWIPLVDINPTNGALYAFPGSHKYGKLPVREVNTGGTDKRQAVYEETVMPREFPRVDLFVKRGSIVFIHGFVVHGSYQNHSTNKRYALLNTYLRKGAPFRPGQTAKREEVLLKRAS